MKLENINEELNMNRVILSRNLILENNEGLIDVLDKYGKQFVKENVVIKIDKVLFEQLSKDALYRVNEGNNHLKLIFMCDFSQLSILLARVEDNYVVIERYDGNGRYCVPDFSTDVGLVTITRNIRKLKR